MNNIGIFEFSPIQCPHSFACIIQYMCDGLNINSSLLLGWVASRGGMEPTIVTISSGPGERLIDFHIRVLGIFGKLPNKLVAAKSGATNPDYIPLFYIAISYNTGSPNVPPHTELGNVTTLLTDGEVGYDLDIGFSTNMTLETIPNTFNLIKKFISPQLLAGINLAIGDYVEHGGE